MSMETVPSIKLRGHEKQITPSPILTTAPVFEGEHLYSLDDRIHILKNDIAGLEQEINDTKVSQEQFSISNDQLTENTVFTFSQLPRLKEKLSALEASREQQRRSNKENVVKHTIQRLKTAGVATMFSLVSLLGFGQKKELSTDVQSVQSTVSQEGGKK